MTVILQTNSVFQRSGPGKIGSAINFPANHKNVLAIPSLKAWFSATSGYAPLGGKTSWIDRKSSIVLVPDGSSSPLVTAAAIGARPALQFGHIARRLVEQGGAALVPLSGSYSIAGVARGATDLAGAWAIWGNLASSTTYDSLTLRTDNLFQLHRRGTAIAITTNPITEGAPFYWVLSWNQATQRIILRLNGSEVINATTALQPADTNLVAGCRQALPGNGAGGSVLTPPVGAFIGELLAFTTALADTANAADLAVLEASFLTDYGAIF